MRTEKRTVTLPNQEREEITQEIRLKHKELLLIICVYLRVLNTKIYCSLFILETLLFIVVLIYFLEANIVNIVDYNYVEN